MDYPSLFDPVPWPAVWASVWQTLVLYWALLLGLKLAGQRVFGEIDDQDLMVLALIVTGSTLGLYHPEAGFWGAAASVFTLVLTSILGTYLSPRNLWVLHDSSVTRVLAQPQQASGDHGVTSGPNSPAV